MTKLPVQSLRLMGNALIFAGDDPACVAWLRKAHRQHPGDSLISFDLAFHLRQLPSADLVEVLRFAEAGLAAQPSPLMYDFVGNILSKLGRYDEAIELYRKAIELKPDYALGHINLGNALRQKGHLIEAIACYRKAIELSPKQSWVHNNLAAALDRQGKQDEATAAYREAIRLKADEELAAAERAEADWLRIVAAAGEDPAPWVQCGRFYAALGKQQQAAECFAEAIAPKSAKRPPLAAIPFSADEAVRLQRAWADHLGVPVEFENSLGMTFRLIPPGAFDMGTPPDVRQQIVEKLRRQGVAEYLVRPHEEEGFVRVFLTAPYYLARCEVTVQQFRKFVEDTGYQTNGEKKGMGGFAHRNGKWVRDPSHLWKSPGEGWELHDDQPVVHISWNDAVAFCNWLSKRDDKPCTLPTEAQWEFACRGGSPTIFGAGDDPAVLADVAWTRETKQLDWTHANARPVGSKKPNPFGLHDMLGNAFEWCTDWYAPGPTGSIPLVDPLNSTATGRRVARGGAWYGRGLENRCGHRMGTAPSDPLDAARGFRIAIVGDLKRVASPTASPEQSTPTSK